MGDIQSFVKWTYVKTTMRDLDDTRLSPNFTLSEFACPCRYHDCNVTLISRRLIEALQRLRDVMKEPLTVTSGYRCERHNTEVGGSAKRSQHSLGLAADVRTESRKNMDHLLNLAYRIPDLGGLGQYFSGSKLVRLHLDFRPRVKGLTEWRVNS